MLTPEQIQQVRQSAGMPAQTSTESVSLSDRIGVSQAPKESPIMTGLKNVAGTTKAITGGFGEGAAGVALTGIDWAGKKAIEALPENFSVAGVTKQQMLANLEKATPLREQYQQQMGAKEYPTAYGAGKLTGEVASLAAPVSEIGKGVESLTKVLGAGQKTAKLTRAGAEGAAFTAGAGLQEGEKPTASDYYVNTALNVAFPGVGMLMKGAGEVAAPRIINSLIKPLAKDFAYEKNPGKAVAELGITGNSWDDLIKNITSEKEKVGQAIGQVVDKSQNLAQIDLSQTLKSIDEAIARANKTPRTNATLISRLESVKSDLVDNIKKGIDAQTFKGMVGDLTKWTGNVSDDQMVNKALKQVYGSTRNLMDSVLSKELSPAEYAAYKKASEQYGNLMSAETAAKYRDKIVERQDLISFGPKNAGLIAGLGTALATGGAALPSVLAGLSVSAIDKAMATPAFKTRLAKLLTQLAPDEAKTIFEKIQGPKIFSTEEIKNYFKNFDPKTWKGGYIKP